MTTQDVDQSLPDDWTRPEGWRGDFYQGSDLDADELLEGMLELDKISAQREAKRESRAAGRLVSGLLLAACGVAGFAMMALLDAVASR